MLLKKTIEALDDIPLEGGTFVSTVNHFAIV
jgi:hypothetical protein